VYQPGTREMNGEFGAPPRHRWAPMVAELHVNALEQSLEFWCELLGFEIAYRRPVEKFVYLKRPEGAQVMLCQRHARFETGPLLRPLGQGIMLQVYVDSIDPILSLLNSRDWPIYLGPREIWRRTGDDESGQFEVFVQDRDGYLVMLAHSLGKRPAAASE
jgi:catechol 2,3-dioxygenase-like lactoylglutathione lyase family enzyme